jgi:uncharacterized protein (TIGR03437 family)
MPKSQLLAVTAMAAAILLCAPAAAQSQMVGVSITTNLPGGSFWVDGTEYKSSATFSWPEGSKHNLEIRKRLQINEFCDTRWRFQNWSAGAQELIGANLPIVVYTAHRDQRVIGANFILEYRLDVQVNDDPLILDRPCADENDYVNDNDRSLPPNPMGFVDTAGGGTFRPPRQFGQCLSTSGWGWFAADSAVTLNATPYPGFVFVGWELPGSPTTGFLGQVVMNRPWRIRARFAEARRVTLFTAPQPGLSVLLDREFVRTRTPGDDCLLTNNLPGTLVPYPAPTNPPPPFSSPSLPQAPYAVCSRIPLCNGDFDLRPGSDHLLGAPPSQRDAMGNLWVFDHWDLGPGFEAGGQNSVVNIPMDYRPHTFTAHFVRGARVSFVTAPVQLKLEVDGRQNWNSYNFEWGVGHKHTFAAPLEQTDARGRKWRFTGWSNDGPVEQELIVPDNAHETDLRFIARYELLGQVTLRSDPTSLVVSVDGEQCTTPCTYDRPAGEQITITALPDRSFSEDTRVEFSAWGDTEDLERTYTFSQDAHTLTARYQYLHRLQLFSDPEEGAKYNLTPAAGPGGFFTAGVRVQVDVESNPGFKFRRWDGVLSGTFPTGSVLMNRPATVVARFDRVPALPEGAVQNAAGETPDPVVAPGSLIAIRGKHLARGSETSYFNPLKQSLMNVTVHVGDRLLPLVRVEPHEIIALLPSNLPPGEHTLTVRQLDQPPVSADFEVALPAPGLFTQPESELPYAEIYHSDGKPVTPERPARPGETLLLIGTGFGPTSPPWLDGFAPPETPQLPLRDAMELLVDGEPHPHLWAGAQPNRAGRTLIRFVLGLLPEPVEPVEDEEQQNLRLQVRMADRVSNTVLVPVSRTN